MKTTKITTILILCLALLLYSHAHAQIPTGWYYSTIGDLGFVPSYNESNQLWTLQGNLSISSSMHVYKNINGDCEIVARINSQEAGTASVEIRENLTSSAKYVKASIAELAGGLLAYRSDTGEDYINTYGDLPIDDESFRYPYWFRLERKGNRFTAYMSPDGVGWDQIGSVEVLMSTSISIGMSVTKQASSWPGEATAKFDNVTVIEYGKVESGTGGWIIDGDNMYSAVSGNVGIGTTNPSRKLDVDGDIQAVRFRDRDDPHYFVNPTGTPRSAVFKGDVGIGTLSPQGKLHVSNGRILLDSNQHVSFMNSYGQINDTLVLFHDTDLGSNINEVRIFNFHEGPIKFYTTETRWQAEPRVTITRSGDVGIGTLSPQGKLDVNGSIYQRGNQLHADYVFEPGYDLESIEEHSRYMWTHKHLKAIPKAKVDVSGQEIVEVGEHRKGIVEELEKAHIYVDQLHKRIRTLEERLAKLEAQHRPEQ